MGRQEERKQAAYEIVGANIYDKYFRETFVKGAKWADKTMVDKACKWLASHINDYLVKGRDIDYMFDDFRKAMEDET